jgi:hypothetical protein
MKQEREKSFKGKKAFLALIHDEKVMNFPDFESRQKREKYWVTS